MTFDFSKLALPQATKAQTDPYKIFASLPRLQGAPNDLWSGQSDALSSWHRQRDKTDVLLSLNTGAGKTLVGVLIAKSLCNEGLENVLYVCPTNDLVLQTAAQARAVGIDVTTRIKSKFDNDLFESGKTFCITNYHAVFNGLSGLRRRFFPDAIIFDDAHVAEANMRSAFTLTVKQASHAQLHASLANLFLPGFRELGREGIYRDSFDTARMPQAVLVPPDLVSNVSAQIEAAFVAAQAGSDDDLKYAYEHLKDHFANCAIVVRSGVIELTPPFLPSLALDVFDRKVRRIYLSATLHNKADIVRAFGRSPTVIIEPTNDAGNGERLILTERELIASPIDSSFVGGLKRKHKVLVAVPSYPKAREWESVAKPPQPANFSAELNMFRQSNSGAFVLVNRVDGIDLPHDTCRVMVLDGVPRGESLLERYQFEYLQMRTFAASRIANRLVQLFGRINRGRSDYGAFLIAGRDLNTWLANDKHVAMLPDLLKRQILLGRSVQDGMNVRTLPAVESLLETVISSRPRDQSWLNYYSQFLNAGDVAEEKTERAKRSEERNLEAAKAEAEYAKAIWNRDFQGARTALDTIVADTARADEKLAGWHNLWIGAALHQERDVDQSRLHFVRARGQLGLNLIVSTGPAYVSQISAMPTRRIVSQLIMLTSLGRESFTRQLSRLERDLAPLDGGSPAQMEEAVRLLGETLGFIASRPDNDHGTGPDVLWIDKDDGVLLGLELKTDKLDGSRYSKDDVSQSLDHLSWLSDHSEGANCLGVVLVGPAHGCHDQANPTSELYETGVAQLGSIRDQIVALLRDAYEITSTDRDRFISDAVEGLQLKRLAEVLLSQPLKLSGNSRS
ncbi:DEAD/DEAH box helicase family protein [Sphingomonas sp. BK345]|uniref:DEAD/DEAH box helicase family protein n=1 Tax=Sphingomonas sp. BK345 TaxID=2586980 RepID=UPI00160995F5|nr:DEAD/DEAH box helicase family protein [Sphingomonas sp. BK345]MBB3474024.1 hypothetical protein [Sphingomonas sp. BK345]